MSTCQVCEQPLTIELDPEDFNEATSSAAGGSPSTVPDDLQLSCGCHFHWQCLLDESSEIFSSLTCPSCDNSLASGSSSSLAPPQVFTSYHNEGGMQENLDIFPLIKEEAYLNANPAARPARAYMTMCAEGDVGGIVELLNNIAEDSHEGDMSPTELLRFQDPLDGGKTGLLLAIEKSQQEVVWLLLWLASGIPDSDFPEEVVQAAQVMGAGRETAIGPDIRSLRDEQGRAVEQVAGTMGNKWAGLLGAGVLGA